MRLIQGFFYQMHGGLGLGFSASLGTVVTIRKNPIPVMFSGAIFHYDHDPAQPLTGGMHDDFGESVLSDILITPEEIHFEKWYVRNGERIPGKAGLCYVLHPAEGNTWFGSYTVVGPEKIPVAQGPARCIVTEIDNRLFADDIKRFEIENGFVEEEPEEQDEEEPTLPLFEEEDDEIPF